MKKFISFALAVVLLLSFVPTGLFSVTASAETTGTTGDCTWRLDGTVLTITGVGKMGDYNNTSNRAPWGEDITAVIIEEGVTSIGKYAFYGCDQITETILPDSLVSIKDQAFFCCSKLKSISIPQNVTSISARVFNSCSALASIQVDGNNTVYYSENNCLVEKTTKTLIAGCNSSVIPTGVKSIGEYAFSGCYSLTSVVVPEGVTSIDKYAFNYCSRITEIVLPDSLISIGDDAFSSCYRISSITIPQNVSYIGTRVFSYCTVLTSLEVDENNTTYYSENNCIIEKTTKTLVAGCKSSVIPTGVTSIGESAFNGCSASGSITIPEGVTSIGRWAFTGSNYTSITIPKSLTKVAYGAFYLCDSLSDVYYGGNRIDKNRITIENNNSELTTANWHYSPCENNAHVYSYDCSVICQNCDYSRTTENLHVYDDRCDETCNLCGERRKINHFFEQTGEKTAACKYCGITKTGDFVITTDQIITLTYEASRQFEFVLKDESIATVNVVSVSYTVSSLGAKYKISAEVRPIRPGETTVQIIATTGGLLTQGTLLILEGQHQMQFVETTKEASCAEPGINLYACKFCDYWEERIIPALDHTEVIDIAIAPTCTETGLTQGKHCSVCNEVFVAQETIPALGHRYVSTVTEPTCLNQGYTTYTCFCGDSYVDDYVNALGHSHVAVVTAPTCTAQGYTTHTCHCGDSYVDSYTNALGHSYTAKVTAPTCTAQGYTTYTCTCGDSYKDTYVAAIGHTYVSSVVKPAPGKQGYTQHTCHCGDYYRTGYVAALDLSVPKVSITVDAATGKPTLNWANGGEGVTYEIYRATKKTGTYTKVATVATSNWSDGSASVGKTYYYKVKAIYAEDTRFNSDFSAEVSATAKCATPELTVKAGSTGKPVLTWNKVTSAKKYEIWRSVDGGAFKKLTTTTKLTYTDSKATAGAECTYKVKALGSKSAYNSEFSNTDSCYVICAAPSLTLKLDSKTGIPALSWKKITGAKSYAIYRSQNGGEYQLVTTTTAVSYKDQTAATDNKYSYYVVTVGKAEVFNSVASAVKTVTLAVKAPKLTGTATSEGAPVINWAAVDNAVSYKVYRSTKSSKGFVLVQTTEGLTYTDTSVAVGKTYYYKVVAVGANTESAMSSYLKLTGKCATPTIQVSVNEDSGKPVITWEKITGAKKYTVYRATSENGKYTKLGTSKTTSYTDTKATPGNVYYYKVVANASSSKNNSGYSNIVSCGVNCGTPVVKVSNNASGKTVLSWSKVTGAIKYEIYLLGAEDYVVLDQTTGTSWTDESCAVGEGRYYGVRAIAAKAEFSSEVSEAVFGKAIPATPKVSGKVGANNKPVISWAEVEGATKYVVYRSTKSSKGYTVIGKAEGLSYEDLTAAKGKTYYYKVVAVGDGVESAQSSYAKVKSK